MQRYASPDTALRDAMLVPELAGVKSLREREKYDSGPQIRVWRADVISLKHSLGQACPYQVERSETLQLLTLALPKEIRDSSLRSE